MRQEHRQHHREFLGQDRHRQRDAGQKTLEPGAAPKTVEHHDQQTQHEPQGCDPEHDELGLALQRGRLLDYALQRLADPAHLDAALLTSIVSIFIWRMFVQPLKDSLKSETARAKAVMDAATEGIITIDERGIIGSFNPAAERMFGYAAAEAIGKNVKILMPERHAGAHDDYIANYLRTEKKQIIDRPREVPALRKDGSAFSVELNVA